MTVCLQLQLLTNVKKGTKMLQNFKTYLLGASLLLFSMISASSAYANLLITPLQVVFKARERTTEIVLVNTSRDTNTYRLVWEQLDQVDVAGGYVPAEDSVRKERQDLEDFAVFTPRQITLKPGDKQTIRIAVRRPKDLEDGEYKSHLKFSIVPDLTIKEDLEQDVSEDEIGLAAKVYASYSIPVVYRVGDVDLDIKIGTPKFSRSPKTSQILLDFPVERSGKHGVIGMIKVYHTPNGGKESEIGALGNANLFSEINSRDFTIITNQTALSPGKLRIVFQRAEGAISDYTVLAEKTFPVGN